MQRISDRERIASFLTGTAVNSLFSVLTILISSAVLAHYSFSHILHLLCLQHNVRFVDFVLPAIKETIGCKEIRCNCKQLQCVERIDYRHARHQVKWV